MYQVKSPMLWTIVEVVYFGLENFSNLKMSKPTILPGNLVHTVGRNPPLGYF